MHGTDTVTQASALLKQFDFEFLINLVVTQKILAYTSSITTRLQSRDFDIMKAYEEIHLVIATLEKIWNEVDKFHHDCFVYAKELANRIDVEVKKPCTCQRQRSRQKAMSSSSLLDLWAQKWTREWEKSGKHFNSSILRQQANTW